jgi:hypothetical protein
MKLREAIAQAIDRQDASAAGAVADFLRFRAGLDYARTFALVQKVRPTVTPAEWDGLLYEADTQG